MLMMLLASELSAKDIGENILIRDTNVHLKRDSESLQDSQAYWVAMSQSYMRVSASSSLTRRVNKQTYRVLRLQGSQNEIF